MKLVSNKQKKTKIIVIVSIIVAIVAIIGIAAAVIGTKYPFLFDMVVTTTTKEPPTVIRSINVSKTPDKWEYLVGEEFDPTGMRVQVVMNKQTATYFVDASQVELSGFDSSEPNDNLKITVKYQGYETSFTVVVREPKPPAPTLESIKLSDNFKTTYNITDWNKWGPDFYGVKIICTYSDGTEEEVAIKTSKHCDGINQNLTSAGTTQFTVKYEGLEYTVTVTITE